MRKTIFWLHLITGVVAGIVILIMSVTGVLLMYQKQITAWADGAKVRVDESAGTPMPIDALLARIQEAEKKPPTSVTINSDPRSAVALSWGREKFLFVHPYTGVVVSEGSKTVRGFFQLMIDWHRWLGMSGENRPIGKAITGACNLGFLFLVVSGLYLWWPRTKKALRAVLAFDFSLRGKARDWNWHNVAGFWSSVPLFFVVLTATFFSYSWPTDLLYKATGNEPPPKPAAAAPTGGASRSENRPSRGEAQGERRERSSEPKEGSRETVADHSGLANHFATAQRQVEGWTTVTLRMPTSPGGALNFTVDRGSHARPDLRSQITIDPKTGSIQKTESYGSYNVARKIRLWVRWIHTGEAGGFIGQTIAGIASAAGALLVWTGVALAVRRFLKRKETVS
jgi:uncharacterized iron-regulated membrane protein